MGLDLQSYKDSLEQQIEKKAVDLGDELRDNLALDSIAKAQIIKTLKELESFVLGLLADTVIIKRKQLEDLVDEYIKIRQKRSCQSEEWKRATIIKDFIEKKLLEVSK